MYRQAIGIQDFKIPIRIREKEGRLQNTIATISMQATLPSTNTKDWAAIFTQVTHKYLDIVSVESFATILSQLSTELDAARLELEVDFPYFLVKRAPVSEEPGLMEYHCSFSGGIGEKEDFMLSVCVPVTTLCPCSKEISEAGAHNQRSKVKLSVTCKKTIWLEDLITLVEQSGSCEVYSLLKRPDEKYVTEKAYNNPMFVEDVVRKLALLALDHPDIGWFSASVESYESIHKHNAYAYVDSDKIR
ncbi:MAG: GTP cyclohydrolase I FolE2 [Deltaproteobacteria bacterium]|nr:MAG: GTP cyclohydrolase I FolE2 [Deltaproteobacteria bacterium]